MSQLDDIKYKDWDSNKGIELTLFLKDYREKFISHMTSKDIPKSDEEIEQYNNEKREFWNGLRLIAGIWIVDIRDSIFSNILFPWKDTYFQVQNAKKDAFQRFSESPKDINIKKEFDKIDEKFGDDATLVHSLFKDVLYHALIWSTIPKENKKNELMSILDEEKLAYELLQLKK